MWARRHGGCGSISPEKPIIDMHVPFPRRPYSSPDYCSPVEAPLAPQIPSVGPIAVTVTSPGYDHLTAEAVRRFRRFSGLEVVVLPTSTEPAFAAKLNLDLFVAPRPIVFFDVDLWLLRPYDFRPLAKTGRWCAVPDPGAWNPRAFPHTDSVREGWEKDTYFNSGLFVCDLSQWNIREVFAMARQRLADCHAGNAPRPVDWTDQYFLNWAVQQQPGLLKRLPFALNFYKPAVDWGSYPSIPREIIGLHAAGTPVRDKLRVLEMQAAVFGGPTDPMIPEAVNHYYQRALLAE
jgi:hypothetical protein